MIGISRKTTVLELRGGRQTVGDRGNGKNRGEQIVGLATVLDDEFTRSFLMRMSWRLMGNGYATVSILGKTRLLHRLVYENYFGPMPHGKEIDHIDRDKLNNVPANLRAVTHGVNKANSRKYRNNTSGFKGVYWEGRGKKWRSQIAKDHKQIKLGYFADIHAAARAVNAAYRKHYPEVAIPNPEVELQHSADVVSAGQ